MPSRLDQTGLVVSASTSDGAEHYRFDLGRFPGDVRLRREIAAALVLLCNEGGSWRSMSTIHGNTATVGNFLHWLDRQDIRPGTVAELRRSHWDAWLLHCAPTKAGGGGHKVSTIKTVLMKCPTLPGDTRNALNRRVGKPPPKEAVESYTTAEFDTIRRAALRCLRAAETRISGNMAVLRPFWARDDLDAATLAKARALELVLDGDELTSDEYKALGAWKAGRALVNVARYSLFLRWDEAWACSVLLVCENGWNSTVVTRATVPSATAGAGEDFTIYTQHVLKPRRGRDRHMTNNLVDDGKDGPGRTMTRIINATEPARLRLARQGEPTDRLLLWLNRRHATRRGRAAFRVGPPTEKRSRRVSPWVTNDLPNITLRGLRQVHQSRIKRSSSQNSRRVHEDVYLLRDVMVRQDSQGVIAQGQQNALDAALGGFRMRLLDDADVDQRIRAGQADTPIGACEDIHHHPVTGELCRESFLACLGCENAVATPRHLPRLVFLHECLDELASALHPDDWREHWSTHHTRLTALLDTHTTPTERAQARARVTAQEKSLIDRLLRGEFAP